MGYYEAINDGIRIDRERHRYFPKCQFCGKEVMTLNYRSALKYTCALCKLEKKNAKKKITDEHEFIKKEERLDKAIVRLDKVANLDDYVRPLNIIRQNLHKDKWFESTEEILVALELLKNNYKIKHQVKINRYRVDFLIPELKVVLEVDGKHFHLKENREDENFRDCIITLNLGSSWEIIHIMDDDINTDITNLVPAIKKVLEKRRYIRSKYNGEIPKWYSDRDI